MERGQSSRGMIPASYPRLESDPALLPCRLPRGLGQALHLPGFLEVDAGVIGVAAQGFQQRADLQGLEFVVAELVAGGRAEGGVVRQVRTSQQGTETAQARTVADLVEAQFV